jgi:hypothetical protein
VKTRGKKLIEHRLQAGKTAQKKLVNEPFAMHIVTM